MIVIRPIERQDAKAILDLMDQLGYPCSMEEMHRRIDRLTGKEGVWAYVFEEEKRVHGFIVAQCHEYFPLGKRVCRITALSVDEPCRKKGIGKQLVAFIEKLAKERGCVKIELTCNNTRIESHRFYEKLGYMGTSTKFEKNL